MDYEAAAGAAAGSASTASISAGVLALICSACRPEASCSARVAYTSRWRWIVDWGVLSKVVGKRGEKSKPTEKEIRKGYQSVCKVTVWCSGAVERRLTLPAN